MAELWMAQLRFDGRELRRAARRQGIPRDAEDLGYVVHGQLAALFGELAPKPFRVLPGAEVEVLGYGSADEAELRRHAEVFALPEELAVLRALKTKRMPSRWAAGRRLGFEVRLCPVVRTSSATPRRKAGAEVDAFLAACDRAGDEKVDRRAVYRDWLEQRLHPAARLLAAELVQLRLTRLFRRTQGETRRGEKLERPDALFRGELEIADPEAFAKLLARGLGRHRAFGFGMLLLRPPGAR